MKNKIVITLMAVIIIVESYMLYTKLIVYVGPSFVTTKVEEISKQMSSKKTMQILPYGSDKFTETSIRKECVDSGETWIEEAGDIIKYEITSISGDNCDDIEMTFYDNNDTTNIMKIIAANGNTYTVMYNKEYNYMQVTPE